MIQCRPAASLYRRFDLAFFAAAAALFASALRFGLMVLVTCQEQYTSALVRSVRSAQSVGNL